VTDISSATSLHDNLVTHGLIKSFGSVHAGRGLDLELRRVTKVTVLGLNGAGNATTVDTLTGLTKPDRSQF